MLPDDDTKNRIKNLAVVGTALFEATHDDAYQTNYYAAKEALKRFLEGIKKLELDEESMKGMEDLVSYLDKKIDRRLEASI